MKRLCNAIILCFFALVLSGCCGCNNSQQVADLQRQIDDLKAQLGVTQTQPTEPSDGLNTEGPMTPSASSDATNITAPDSGQNGTEGTAPAITPPAIKAYIDEQLKSNDYKSWLSAAECVNANPEQLLLAAQKCASIENSLDFAIDIAKALSVNPSIDGKALAALADTRYHYVALVAAQSEYADDYALQRLAERCARIENNIDLAADIAKAICEHPNATDEAIAALSSSQYYCVLRIAAKSSHAGETALTRLAERCASIENNLDFAIDIAKAICANPNVTANAVQPLASAYYSSVSKIGHDAIDALTP